MFEEIPMRGTRPPRAVYVLRAIGGGGMTVVIWAAVTTDPRPALGGAGLVVLLALVAAVAGVAGSFPRVSMRPGVRLGALSLMAAAGVALAAAQPDGAWIGLTYFVVSIGALRLQRVPASVLSALMVAGQAIAILFVDPDPGSRIVTLVFSTLPWFLIIRLMRELREGRDRAETLVGELHESREAHARSVAMAERARLARDMHDVLAHSLSALALQLEGTRLQAVDRGSDPEVVAAIARAHGLAAAGLEEARGAIAALRGDELPGPERLQALADAFEEHTAARCTVRVTGEPRGLSPEARLALYRTAQEALTNVRRHAAADTVEIHLDHAAAGTTLTVRDHGPGAPVTVGGPGGGYGLTGMRERAELLGGHLRAAPAPDGFCVELWLPAEPA
jgi:signal transduction histidine kinase